MTNLSFKQGNLSNIQNTALSDGVVYFSKDNTSGHSNHGYIFYDSGSNRIPINGSGYYMAPDRKEPSKKSIFTENNLFNSGPGAFIGVGHNDKDLWLHKSSTSSNSNRGLWSPLWGGSEEEPVDNGAWILRVGKHSDTSTEPAEYLYLGSPNYINKNGVESNIYTIRPAVKNSYLLGDSQYKWADIYTSNITSNTGTFSSTLTANKVIAEDSIETSNISNILRIVSLSNGDHFTPITNSLTFLGDIDHRWKKIYSLDIDANGDLSVQGTTTTSGLITANGGIAGNLTGNVTGNASTATKLKTARTLKVGSGGSTVSFNGSANVTIPLAISTSWSDGKTAGPKLKVTVNGVESTETTVPVATSSVSGIVTISDQTFSGKKSFSSIQVNNPANTGTSGDGVAGHLMPASTNSYQLGHSNYYWKKLYATDIYIDSIRGEFDIYNSTRKGKMGITTSKNIANNSSNTTSYSCLYTSVHHGEGDTGYVRTLLTSASDNSTFEPLYMNNSNKTLSGYISLGTAGRPWQQLYADDTSINTSDIRLKEVQDEKYLYKLLNMYDQVTPIAYKRKNLSEENNYQRIHVGLSAQDVEEKMIINDLTSLDFGGLCIDTINPEVISYYKEVLPDNRKYSLRYSEFHGLHILKNHQQDARLTELENKNKELENTISTLKTQVELLKLAIGG